MPSNTIDPRLRLLAAYEAALDIAIDLDLDHVLSRIAQVARQVVPSDFAALGVCDKDGRILQFITSGMDQETIGQIGPMPVGQGLLGVLIKDAEPLMVDDIGADPRSIGFPAHHPPMKTLLGVPIRLGERVLGDLYLTDRQGGGSYSADDLEALQVLARHAAAAIERAELYRHVEEARQEAVHQRDNLAAIIGNLPSGVIIFSSPTDTELSNEVASRMIYDSVQSRIQASDFELLDHDSRSFKPADHPVARALAGQTVRNQQMHLRCANGRMLPVLVQSAPLPQSPERSARAILVLQDITRLREAEQLKDDFLSLVSHEFRTPLTAINGGAHLLRNQGDVLDPELRQELLQDIVDESDKLDSMLSNLLGVAAIMAGRLLPETGPVLIEPLAKRVANGIGKRSPLHSFQVMLPKHLPAVEGDPELIEQVLRNLYENAVKYSPAGGEIRTAASADESWVTVSVTDQGAGIAAEFLPSLFQRFRRPGADPTVRGMGLGLYLCRLLVEAQGGRIGAASPGPGQGSTISVSLPVSPQEDAWGDET